MPVPGAGEIYGAWPKVHLSLKMQKSEVLNRWWFKDHTDVPKLIRRLRSDTPGEDRATIVKLFKIFTGKKYSEDEILVGLKNAALFGEKIQGVRSDYKNNINNRIKNAKEKFFTNKIAPKLREIYEKREIPLFNSKTHGRLEFLNRTINEKDLKDVKEFNDERRIWVFKFRDATGKLSLNFYSEKPQRRQKMNRWK
jgi:hypothetical protein